MSNQTEDQLFEMCLGILKEIRRRIKPSIDPFDLSMSNCFGYLTVINQYSSHTLISVGTDQNGMFIRITTRHEDKLFGLEDPSSISKASNFIVEVYNAKQDK